jgi:hypothetical protein
MNTVVKMMTSSKCAKNLGSNSNSPLNSTRSSASSSSSGSHSQKRFRDLDDTEDDYSEKEEFLEKDHVSPRWLIPYKSPQFNETGKKQDLASMLETKM